jgi:hypothetical protein
MMQSPLNFKTMPELTKEYFDKVVANLATRQDLAPLATREQIDELARMTKHGFDDVLERLDVRERMHVVEQKLAKIGEALHITL